MIQNKYISILNNLFRNIETVKSAIIIGRFGRNTPKANSDIDYQLLVSNDFSKELLLNEIKKQFDNILKHTIYLKEKKKWCFYITDDYIKIEIFLCYKLDDLDKYYLGSEIYNPSDAIIFDKTKKVKTYLKKICQTKLDLQKAKIKEEIEHLINIFQNYFEGSSVAHSKSDGYKFYVLFGHSLNAVIKLIYLCEGQFKYEYMPSNFLTDYSYKLNLGIEKLGTMNLKDANDHKRKLLDIYIKYLNIATEKFDIDIDNISVINFLEAIYKRDLLWNFRDIAKFNPKLRREVIYRSSALCLDSENIEAINKYEIKNIIDLRADREIKGDNYNSDLQSKLNIIHAPFDPWAQSAKFKRNHNTGTNVEIAYKFFSLECKKSIKKIIETIIHSQGAIDIHCHSGKDRTGIVATILHLLSDCDKNVINQDYLASEMDTELKHLKIFSDIVTNSGGIDKYLNSCDITDKQIQLLKERIMVYEREY